MIDLARMINYAASEGEPTTYACVDCVAAAMPAGCALRAIYDAFQNLPGALRRRALRNPLAAARFVARELKCKKLAEGPAWGIVRAGPHDTFAVRTASGAWFARSRRGIARVHTSRAVSAWEVK